MEYTLQDYIECDHFGTVTLQPSLYELPVSEQIKASLKPLFEILKPLTTNFLLTLELTKKNNIHYHFICKMKDKELDPFVFVDNLKSYNFKKKKQVFGFSECEQIRKWEKSALYITKDISATTRKINQKAWYDYKYTFQKPVAKIIKPKTTIQVYDNRPQSRTISSDDWFTEIVPLKIPIRRPKVESQNSNLNLLDQGILDV